MRDPVSGELLDRSWQPLSLMPARPSKPGDKEFVCLVIVGDDKMFGEPMPLINRVHVAVFHPNIVSIGGHFEFDMPPIVAWKPLTITPER